MHGLKNALKQSRNITIKNVVVIFSPYLGSLKCICSGFILISLCLYCPVVFSVALDDDGCLTSPLGVNMAEFPLEPMLAKMLLVSGKVTFLLQVPRQLPRKDQH